MRRAAGVEVYGRLQPLRLVVEPGLLLASRACCGENESDVSREDKLEPLIPAFLPLTSSNQNDPQRVMDAISFPL